MVGEGDGPLRLRIPGSFFNPVRPCKKCFRYSKQSLETGEIVIKPHNKRVDVSNESMTPFWTSSKHRHSQGLSLVQSYY